MRKRLGTQSDCQLRQVDFFKKMRFPQILMPCLGRFQELSSTTTILSSSHAPSSNFLLQNSHKSPSCFLPSSSVLLFTDRAPLSALYSLSLPLSLCLLLALLIPRPPHPPLPTCALKLPASTSHSFFFNFHFNQRTLVKVKKTKCIEGRAGPRQPRPVVPTG